jgi:hypothetical protein
MRKSLTFLLLFLCTTNFYLDIVLNSRLILVLAILVYILINNNILFKKNIIIYFILFSFLHLFTLLIRFILGYNNLWIASAAIYIDFFSSIFISFILLQVLNLNHVLKYSIFFIIAYFICILYNFFTDGSFSSEIQLGEIGFFQFNIFYYFIFLFYVDKDYLRNKFVNIIYILGIFFSNWRALLFGTVILLFFRLSKWIRLTITILIIYFLISYAPVVLNLIQIYINGYSGNDFTHGRINLWYKSIEAFRNASIIEQFFGFGPGNFPLIIQNFSQSSEIVVGSLDFISDYNIEVDSRVHPHNFIFDTLINFGILGLFIYLTLIKNILKKCSQNQKIILISCLLISLNTSVMYLSALPIWFFYFLDNNRV